MRFATESDRESRRTFIGTTTLTHKYLMRIREILNLAEDDSGIVEPVTPSESRPDDAYQSKPEKRGRYQGGSNSRWQTPQKRREPKPSTPTSQA